MYGLSQQLGMGVILQAKNLISRETARAGRDLKRLRGTAGAVSDDIVKQAEAASRAIDRYRTGLRISMATMGAGAALAAPLVLAGKQAMRFQDQMQDIRSLLTGTGITGAAANTFMSNIESRIKSAAASSRVAIQEIAASSYQLISALGPELGAAAISTTQRLAVAGKGTMQDATQIMTALMATYGEMWGESMSPMQKAIKIGNILSSTVAAFNTDLTVLSEGMKYAIPIGKAMNVSLEEVSATIGMLQTQGLEASQAGTAYAAMMRSLVKLTDKAGKEIDTTNMSVDEFIASLSKAADIDTKVKRIGKIGLINEAMKLRSLPEILADFRKVYGEGELSAAEQAEIFREMGEEGARALLLLIGQEEELAQKAKFAGEALTLEGMFTERMASASAQWAKLSNQIKVFGMSIGKHLLPIFESVMKWLNSLFEDINLIFALFPNASKWAAYGGAIASGLLIVGGAVGTVVMAMKMWQAQMIMAKAATAMLAKQVALTSPVIKSMGVVTLGAKTSLLSILGPLALVLVGVTAVAAAAYILVKNWEDVKRSLKEKFWGVGELGQPVMLAGPEYRLAPIPRTPKGEIAYERLMPTRIAPEERPAEHSMATVPKRDLQVNITINPPPGTDVKEMARAVQAEIEMAERMMNGGKL